MMEEEENMEEGVREEGWEIGKQRIKRCNRRNRRRERWRMRRKKGVGEGEMDKKICRRKGKMRSSCRKRRIK